MTTTTTLVHRTFSGSHQWWRAGLVYEIASPMLGAGDMAALDGLIDHIGSLGFGVVLIRPSRMAITADMTPFSQMCDRAHAAGLRVVVRISGALGPVTGEYAGQDNRIVVGAEQEGRGLIDRAESFLAAGADGIDLGTIVPPEVMASSDLSRLTEYFNDLHALVAQHVEDGMIGADVSVRYPEAMHHHLQEDWLHHLRDDSLVLARWEAASITDYVSRSFEEHDRFGATLAWRVLPSYRLGDHSNPGDARSWFAVPPVERRRRGMALQALMLALPGAVYLRQGDEVALPDEQVPDSPLSLSAAVNREAALQGDQFASPLATVRHATHLRRERRLAEAPLAFVDGIDWAPPGVLTLLVRNVLVLVNTTTEPVHLPPHAEVLLASRVLSQSDGHLLVPATTTVWVDAQTVA